MLITPVQTVPVLATSPAQGGGHVGRGDSMEKETKILLLTHGGWGEALVDSLRMILGAIDCVHEIPLKPSYTLPEYMSMVREYVDTISPDSLIIADLFGGTPSNVGAAIGNQTGIKVFCGLNAPMLLEACVELQSEGKLDFDAILAAGASACKDVVAEVKSGMN